MAVKKGVADSAQVDINILVVHNKLAEVYFKGKLIILQIFSIS